MSSVAHNNKKGGVPKLKPPGRKLTDRFISVRNDSVFLDFLTKQISSIPGAWVKNEKKFEAILAF